MTGEDEPREDSSAARVKRRPRLRWRRLLGWAALLMVAAVVILLSSPYWLPTGWLRARLERELEEEFPVEATVGELSFRLGRGIRVRCGDVKLVSEAQGARLELALESLEGEALIGPLLAGRLKVSEVALESVRCRLEQGPEGLGPLLARWQAKAEEERRKEGPPAREEEAPRVSALEMERILITDLVFTLVDEERKEVRQSPKLDLLVEVESLKPVDLRFEVEGGGFIARGELARDPGPAAGILAEVRLSELDLQALSDCLRFFLDSGETSLAGVLREGTVTFSLSAEKDRVDIQATTTVEHLKAQAGAKVGAFSTTRLQVQGAEMALRRDKGAWEFDLKSLPIEAGVFDLRLPEVTAATQWPRNLRLSGRRLSGSLTASARKSDEGITGSLATVEPFSLVEVHLNGEGEPGPLLTAERLEASVKEARVAWRPEHPMDLAFSAGLQFSGVAPGGLLAGLGVPVSVEPLEGDLDIAVTDGALQVASQLRCAGLSVHGRAAGAKSQFGRRSPAFADPAAVRTDYGEVGPFEARVTLRAEDGVLQGVSALSCQSLSVNGETFKAEFEPWEAEARFTFSPSDRRLEVTSGSWSCLLARLHLAAGPEPPLAATLAGLSLEGSLTVAPAGEGWSVAGSGKVDLGPLSLRSEQQEVGGLEALELSGSAEAVVSGGGVDLTALQAEVRVLGARVSESLTRRLPGWPERAGLRLAGEAEVGGTYDGRRWQAEVSGTGQEVGLTWTDERGSVALNLDGLTVSLEAGDFQDGSGIKVGECHLDSPVGQVSWHGVLRRVHGKPHLYVAGHLSSTWEALASQWQALVERLPTKLRETLSSFDFEGPVSLEIVEVSGSLDELKLSGWVNLDGSAVRYEGELLKPAGERGRMPIQVVVAEQVRLEELALELGALPRIRITGDLDREFSQFRTLDITVEEGTPTLKEMRPEWVLLALSGGLSMKALLEDLRQAPTDRPELRFDHLTVEFAGAEPVRLELDGQVTISPEALKSDDLRVSLDGRQMQVSFLLEGYLELLSRLSQPPEEGVELSPEVMAHLELDLRADVLDLTGLQRLLLTSPSTGPVPLDLARGGESVVPQPVVELTPTSDVDSARPRIVARVAPRPQAVEAWLSGWLPVLVAGLSGRGTVEVAEAYAGTLTVNDVEVAWQLRDGVLALEVCRAQVSGGRFDAAGTWVQLDRWPSPYGYTYWAIDWRPTSFAADSVSRRLPGLSFSGRMAEEVTETIRGELTLDPQRFRQSITGRTHTILTEGMLVGPFPVPEHVRRVFPKLNLSEYKFGTMTNVTTIEKGVFRNEMLFNSTMDLYLVGETTPEGEVEYELGLSVLRTLAGPAGEGAPDLGRLPLMRFTGRIEGTRFVALKPDWISPADLVAELLTEGLYTTLKEGVLDLGYLRGLEQKLPVPGLDLLIGGLDFLLDITIRLIPGLGKKEPESKP